MNKYNRKYKHSDSMYLKLSLKLDSNHQREEISITMPIKAEVQYLEKDHHD